MRSAKIHEFSVPHHPQPGIVRIPREWQASSKLPTTRREVDRYVEIILKPSQQLACDMATD